MAHTDETKRRRPNDENTPARRTASTSASRASSSARPTGARTAPSSRSGTPSARRVRRSADENAPPLPTSSSSKPRRPLGLSDPTPPTADAAAPPAKTARRAALGPISEQARPPVRRQATAPPAPAKAPAKAAPRTPLGAVRRSLFSADPPGRALSAGERERLAGLGATTHRTRAPPRTPRDQIGRAKRLPPLPPVATPQPKTKKGEKRKISVLADPEECNGQGPEERFTPSPETHRTAMTARRLQRQAFAPEPEDRFDEAEEFGLEVELPELDLEDDGFLI